MAIIRTKLAQWWSLWLLVGLVGLFFHQMVFGNLILARGDTFLYFYPYWQAAAAALRQGRVPLWNPELFMGAPFLANSQVGFFYPLNWPLWLLLPTPYAVNATILLHLIIAGGGAYGAGRRLLGLMPAAALLTAVLFALGGYLTAQVEHVNQLQGLAWLPWFFVVLAPDATAQSRQFLRQLVWLSLLLALQLLAGHTQTTFITVVTIGIWLLVRLWLEPRPVFWPQVVGLLGPVVVAGLLALGLTAVQLGPTLQLAQLSSRAGGLALNEVLSFSWHPLLVTRSLLPGYGQNLFSEYVAFLPLTGLILAVVGAWEWRQERQRPLVLSLLGLILVALLLALGQFNPLNWLLARLPGFNLFRVPARWLIVYTLAVSLLAGRGYQSLTASEAAPRLHRPLLAAVGLLLLLLIWGFASQLLTPFIPTGVEAVYERPSLITTVGWLLELLLLAGWWWQGRRSGRWLLFLAVAVLFVASRSQPYNQLTTPEAYFDLRPPSARLTAVTQGANPPGRFLSLSDIFFDPGDQAEIDTVYGHQLSAAARYDYTIAIKQKEIIAPNLSLIYGLSAVDGFDGGILPLAAYSQTVQALLLDGASTSDGRLREFLSTIPPARWLDLLNVQYLITDKVGDVWRDGVFFDLQHPATLGQNEATAVGYIPPFEATELWLVASGDVGEVRLQTDTGEIWQQTPASLGNGLLRVVLPHPARLQAIKLLGCVAFTAPPCDHTWQVAGLSLVDSQDGAFQPLVLGNYRLIHSGDVKIYENLDVLPRAFMVTNWQVRPDLAAALALMAETGFAVGQTAVVTATDLVLGLQNPATAIAPGTVVVANYLPERVVLYAASPVDGLLVLTDAFYPGWQAQIDGRPVPIYPVDGLFRGVFVPAGEHELQFDFVSAAWSNGRWLSLLSLIVWSGLVAIGLNGRWAAR